MSQPACEPIGATIQRLTQDLIALDEQLHSLVEVEGMNLLSPRSYFALQPRVDRLIKKMRALQDAYNRAVTELAICRSGQPLPHRP